jgi:hypothetical protein
MIKYAGIGSRNTPDDVLDIIGKIAEGFSNRDALLRSGGAVGADLAFERSSGLKQIFYAEDASKESIELARIIHPAWDRCSEYAKALHGRNMQIILGRNLDDPVDFVVCWTPGGKPVGGTGTALRLAYRHKIKVFNLYVKSDLQEIISQSGLGF